GMAPHKLPYAHDHTAMDFLQAITVIKPHVLIGATGAPGVFTRDIVVAMAGHCERPTIFALSNPTSRAEATAEQVYKWSEGAALFASGSPFESVELFGRKFTPGQGNNAYIFPGVGLGVLACEASTITDQMILVAAQALAAQVSDDDLEHGTLYPPLADIRAISKAIAIAVAECAFSQNVAEIEQPVNLAEHVEALMYHPVYGKG
ncbi:MAG: malic enzyme-like NAD(P)-binding protein, partial [bacterium]